jgi:hypothetical protein
MMLGKRVHNNSFNRSANKVAFIRETWMIPMLSARPVSSGIRRLRSIEHEFYLLSCYKPLAAPYD